MDDAKKLMNEILPSKFEEFNVFEIIKTFKIKSILETKRRECFRYL